MLSISMQLCTYVHADSTRTAQLKPSGVSTPLRENTALPSSATAAEDDNMYEHITELRPITEQGPTAQNEEIELSSNVAYGKVWR